MPEPIRVLQMVGNLGYAGLETVVMNYYRFMDRKRVQFDFIVCSQSRQNYDDEVERLGGRIWRLPHRLRHPLAYTRALTELFLNHPEYRIFHCHANSAGCAVDLRAARRCGVPVRIAHSHNTTCVVKWQHYLLKPLLRAQPTHRFACSRAAGVWLFGERAVAQDLQVLPNAVDTARFAFDADARRRIRGEFGLGNAVVLGNVGRLHPQKNPGFLLDIFHAYHARQPDSFLLLAGDGPELEALRQKAAALGITDRVRFAGKRDDVPALLSAMDFFVTPSVAEGLSLAAVEAQASGLSCLASDTVTDETRVTNRLAFMSLSQSPEQWAQRLLEQAPAADRTAAVEEVRAAGYDLADCAKRLESFYLGLAVSGR